MAEVNTAAGFSWRGPLLPPDLFFCRRAPSSPYWNALFFFSIWLRWVVESPLLVLTLSKRSTSSKTTHRVCDNSSRAAGLRVGDAGILPSP